MADAKLRVLLVDDHAMVREGVRLMLAGAEDIEVTGEAGTAQAALQLALTQAFDVALLDIALPGRNGLELLKLLRAQRPALPVLMLSMYSEDIYAVRALRYGAAGFLTKNSDSATLIGAVRKVAAGDRHLNPALVDKLAAEIAGRRAPHEALSDREMEVLRLMASGRGVTDIAGALHLSPKTVSTYRARIVHKTGLNSTAELIRYALERGLAI